ncbi:MAG: hypothetical protein E6G34_10530 [Actinobacteria bacterium]|nr:MAG: hypothetical protein E6G34_10530 [Actinomycetota bacterium]
MSSPPRRPLFVALALLCALTLAACGDSHTKVSTGTYAGESGANAPYLDVGPLVYEVQQSRQLNPFDVEDAAYLQGLPASARSLGPGQEWFGVFVQVYNNHAQALPAASRLTISDTQGNTYAPVVPDQTNPFAYRAGVVAGHGRLPSLDSTAGAGPTQGGLLLFKISLASLDNRPLTLRIIDPTDSAETASAELDV